MRIRDLPLSVAGFPSSALPDEILTPGDGQIRALFCWANPLLTMPQTDRVAEAFESLDLLVTPNIEMSATARASHYVFATKAPLETPAATFFIEGAKAIHPGYGWDVPHAQYTPALLQCPPESDLIEDTAVLFRVAKAMGLKLKKIAAPGGPAQTFDMDHEPTTDEMMEILCAGSVVPLSDVRAHDGPKTYPEAQIHVGPRALDCAARLDVGNPDMLQEVSEIASQDQAPQYKTYPFRLVARRSDAFMGSSSRDIDGLYKSGCNPGYLHPSDLSELGCSPGQRISIRSPYGETIAVAAADEALRPGVLSMTHGFGPYPGAEEDPERVGTNVNQLLRMDVDYERFTGMPRMSAVPVSIRVL